MTNADQKAAIRERMASTGENYTTAKRAIELARLKAQSEQRDSTLAEQRTRALNERFDTVAGQLGSDKPPAVRLAGVYAMAALADDWPDHRQMCVDVLCAYLRMPYEPEPGDDASGEKRLAWRASREVRHTVIRVIAAHLNGTAPVSWCGLNFDFAGVVFDGGDFSGAKFSGGTVNFTGAEFSGGMVNFAAAEFSGGTVNFAGAKFSGARVNFFLAKFSGAKVDFAGARFSGGTVGFGYAEFSGGPVNFTSARFSGAEVRFVHSKFTGENPKFTGAGTSGGMVFFHAAEFSGGTVSFSRAEFSSETVDFAGAEFSGGTVSFSDAEFPGGTVGFAGAEFPAGRSTSAGSRAGRSPRTLAQVSICPIHRPVSCRRQLRALHRIARYREKKLVTGSRSPTARRLRLRHRRAPRRRAHPARPPELRRLSSLLRLRDLLRSPRQLPRRHLARRSPRRHPARSPRLPPARSTSSGGPATNQSHDPDPSPDELTGSPTKSPVRPHESGACRGMTVTGPPPRSPGPCRRPADGHRRAHSSASSW